MAGWVFWVEVVEPAELVGWAEAEVVAFVGADPVGWVDAPDDPFEAVLPDGRLGWKSVLMPEIANPMADILG